MNRKQTNGFTLIELLVVISIIALLVSILMPALSKARAQGKAIVCQTNLKSLALGFKFYSQAHDGRHLILDSGMNTPIWINKIGKYIDDVDEARFCPETPETKFEKDLNTAPSFWQAPGTVNAPWGLWLDNKWELGSYGINNYMYGNSETTLLLSSSSRYLNESSVKNSTEVPLFLDCMRYGGNAQSKTTFNTSTIDWENGNNTNTNEIRRFLINRHSKNGNMVFYDGHVEKKYLPDYFLLKWHKNDRINSEMAELVAKENPPKR